MKKSKKTATERPIERWIGTALAGLALARVALPARNSNSTGNSNGNGKGNGTGAAYRTGDGAAGGTVDLRPGEGRGRVGQREAGDHGRDAAKPSDIPGTGWKDVAFRTGKQIKEDNVPLLAAGVAFYAMLALFPALIALVSIYGLVAGPGEVATQLHSLTRAMPAEGAKLITDQVAILTQKPSGSLGMAAVLGILGALWSASSGMRWLLSALSLAYDEPEDRKFVKLRGLSLLLTIGAVIALAISIGTLVATPALFRALGLGSTGKIVINIVRWPLLVALVVFGMSVLYRFGPNRDLPKWRWATWGSVVATVVWLAGSVGFSVYAALAGKFDKTYGSLGGVIVLLLWLYLTAFAILIGAELNAEMEHQTAQDTTRGPEEPMGRRGAIVADEIGAAAPSRH
ncbi:MAG: rane protein [Acidimicrobiaceae bacterium]|nr:rane protein [Acidimicrobiaceae bacterium]